MANGGIIYQTEKSIKSAQPEIRALKNIIEGILELVDFECGGEKVRVDAFRLKNLNHWLVATDSMGLLHQDTARLCNLKCEFCYLRQNPPDITLERARRFVSKGEMETRIRYYDPSQGLQLFPLGYELNEPLFDPKAMEVFGKIRKKDKSKVIVLRTHGGFLTEEKVRELSRYKPLAIIMSLNSADPDVRKKLMGDKRPEIAIRSLKWLKRYGIPFICGITAWPGISTSDVERTVAYADRYDPCLFRMILPGYSKYYVRRPFRLKSFWRKYAAKVRNLRRRIRAPIVIMPSIYEEVAFRKKYNRCYILGVIKNSPAEKAGLRRDDVILEIRSRRVKDRDQARKIMAELEGAGVRSFPMLVERAGKRIGVKIPDHGKTYPYLYNMSEFMNYPYGIILPQGLGRRHIAEMIAVIRKAGAANVVLVSSLLMKPLVTDMIASERIFADFFRKKVSLRIIAPRSKFLGGNIIIGDMMTTTDFSHALQKEIKHGGKPDLVLIPSSAFNDWGLDLEGKSYLEMERILKVPVRLLPTETITY